MTAARVQVIVLAAGLGTRFGGVKQLAPVGPRGEAIVDVLLARAAAAGFDDAIVVVRPEIHEAMRVHFEREWPPALPVQLVEQRPVPGWGKPAGTAHAVLACAEALTGGFCVGNADDVYPASAFSQLARHLRGGPAGQHALVAFPVAGTVIGERPVTRALIEATPDDRLVRIDESTVTPLHSGFGFATAGASGPLAPDALVSMNLWGFSPSILAVLEQAVGEHLARREPDEVRLPDVVAALVARGGVVRVLPCNEPCVGITHPEDVAIVRAALV